MPCPLISYAALQMTDTFITAVWRAGGDWRYVQDALSLDDPQLPPANGELARLLRGWFEPPSDSAIVYAYDVQQLDALLAEAEIARVARAAAWLRQVADLIAS